ncbi:MAG TPA: P-loop NTPase fold protein [Solirubrobacterales bacterium]|nr:P-loop NTPase fold protein [Solirubrobacterales bacterium]
MEALREVGESDELNELVPDHALAAKKSDLFDHADYVDRLMEVVEQASTEHASANIALYGPWGSGKSSIANLFEERLRANAKQCEAEGRAPRFCFLCFDAFKYARQPFLRQFIRELTSKLVSGEATVRKYHRRLYEERSQVEPRFQVHWQKLAWAVVLIAMVFALALHFLQGKAHEIVVDVLLVCLLVVVPSSLFAGLLKLAVPFFSVTSVSSAPDSEEQFEKLFNDILRDELKIDAKSDQRLVVFVDELDRCSPTEVAATLETLRTFLGVPGCIFVVGADQQVLEEALSEHVRQATPPDPANPYYSEGSAYLDKIFQYQLALSPFRVPRLVDFAMTLVRKRPGVWQQVDLEEVIPILLPTHIHSPRRVKVLLNAFALTYGVAARRARSGKLGDELKRRAAEVAKLVCLRVEFPLFARDLAIDDRLPSAVLIAASAIEDGDDPTESGELGELPVEVRRRAIAFARGDLPAAHLLAEARDERGLDGPLVDYKSSQAEGKALEEESESGAGEEPPAPVRHVQALHLVRYLDKTSTIPGPRSDLIHLESAGATFGLEPQLAQQLERDALDNRASAVIESIADLPAKQRVQALLMLGQRAHRSYGVDGRNVMQTLLRALGEIEIPFEQVAPQLAGDLQLFSNRNKFSPRDLPGALAIAVHSNRPLLVDRLLTVEGALDDPALRKMIVKLSPRLKKDAERQVLEAFARELRADGETAARELGDLRPAIAADLLRGGLSLIEGEIEEAMEAAQSGSIESEQSVSAEGEVADPEGPLPLIQERVDQLAKAIPVLAGKRHELAEVILTSILALPAEYADPILPDSLEVVAPVRGQEVAQALVAYSRQWDLPKTVEILEAIDSVAFGSEGLPVDPLLEHIWQKTDEGADAAPEALWPLLHKLMPRKRSPQGGSGVRGSISGSLQSRVESEDAAKIFETRLEQANKLVDARLIGPADVAGAVAESIASTVSPAIGPEQADVQRHLADWVRRAEDARGIQLRHAYEALCSNECWVPSPDRERLQLELASFLRRRGQTVSVPTVAQLRTLCREHRGAAAPAIGFWIGHFATEPAEVVSVVEMFAASPPPSVLDALQGFTHNRRRDRRTQLALPFIENAFSLRTSSKLLRAMRANVAEERKLVAAICDLVQEASNEGRRRRVFDLWGAVEPREPKSWDGLVKRVLLPIAAEGPSAFDEARKALGLAREIPIPFVPELVDGMRAAVPERDGTRARQLERALQANDLIEAAFQKGPVKLSIGRGRPRQK